MQTYTELKREQAQTTESRHAVKDATGILVVSAVACAVAIQLVKIFGLANGMDEHTRLVLSYVGLAVCFVTAPTFLIFGRHLSVRVGVVLSAAVVFTVALLASLVA